MRRWSGILILGTGLVFGGCSSGGDGGTNPGANPAIAISVSPASATVQQGGQTQVVGTLTRSGGFTGTVTLTVEGAPSAITATVGTQQTTGGTTVATITVLVGAATPAQTYTLTVRGRGTGVSDATATFSLTVTAAGSFSLGISSATAMSLTQGQSDASRTISITRTNYSASITLAAEGLPTGVTATFAGNPVGGTSSVMTVIASATAAVGGPVTVTIRGTGPATLRGAGGEADLDATVTFQLTVNAAGSFSIAIAPAGALSLAQGATDNSKTVTITRTDYTAAITLTAEGLPSGVIATFAGSPVNGTSSVMTLSASATAAIGGPVTVTVRGTGPAAPDGTVTFQLTVTAPGSFTLAIGPGPLTMLQGQTNSTQTVTVTRTNYAAAITLTAENLPAGLTASFSPNPATGTSSTLTLTAATGMAPNTYTIIVRGSGPAALRSSGNPVAVEATATLSVTVNLWWNLSYSRRMQISVNAGSAGAPAGYSVPIVLNHAALVAAGKSLANGNDVRIAQWDGTAWSELDRVLDAGSSWNSATTTIWIKTSGAIPPNSSGTSWYLHYGNASAGLPPAARSNVFLFADDFEAGNLNQWVQLPQGLWAVDNSRSHAGTASLRYPGEGDAVRVLAANPALAVADVYFESWWYLSSASTQFDVSQNVRHTGSPVNGTNSGYMTNLYEDRGLYGWFIGKKINGEFFEVAAPAGIPAANTWMRVGTGISGTTLRDFINGVQVNAATGLTELISGSVAFDKFRVPPGDSWWIDDVIVRRYVNPEPVTTLGSEQIAS